MLEITWLGHATFQFRLDSGEVFLMDPWVEGNPKFPNGYDFDRVDAILISHVKGGVILDHRGGGRIDQSARR